MLLSAALASVLTNDKTPEYGPMACAQSHQDPAPSLDAVPNKSTNANAKGDTEADTGLKKRHSGALVLAKQVSALILLSTEHSRSCGIGYQSQASNEKAVFQYHSLITGLTCLPQPPVVS